MKQWIIKLLSDSKNLPSTRLHLAWGCFFLLCFAVYSNKSEPVITAIIGGMSIMCGISVLDKGGKNETNNDNNTDGESKDTSFGS